MGIDIYWRKKLLKHLPKKDDIVALDLASGTADIPILLAENNKKIKQISGIDMSTGMLEIGKQKIRKKGLDKKIKLIKGDACEITFDDQAFDLTTIAFGIRNFDDPLKSLKEIYRVLRPQGRLLILEFSMPRNLIIKGLYLLYFRYFLPLLGRIISKHSTAYKYLNQTVENFPYGKDFTKWMEMANFQNIEYTPLSCGIITLYKGEKI